METGVTGDCAGVDAAAGASGDGVGEPEGADVVNGGTGAVLSARVERSVAAGDAGADTAPGSDSCGARWPLFTVLTVSHASVTISVGDNTAADDEDEEEEEAVCSAAVQVTVAAAASEPAPAE